MKRLRAYLEQLALVRSLWRSVRLPLRYLGFLRDYLRYSQMLAQTGKVKPRWKDRYPCLFDCTATTGFDRHYVYHTAWAARQLADTRPAEHLDIGSSLYFVALISSFVPVRFYDYRPAELHLSGLSCEHADLLSLQFSDNSISSLSCMHVIEHIGLGRYGDSLDGTGDVKAAAELSRVLAPEGHLLVVTPVGRPRTAFNAHRIYSLEQVCALFPDLRLVTFSLIPDDPSIGLLDEPEAELVNRQEYGCGCFCFIKERVKAQP